MAFGPNTQLIFDAVPSCHFTDCFARSCQLSGTNSGAHSDVYDKEMGRFLGVVMPAAVK
jgi:hypothetical protein